jgi:acyl-CoA thioester hydrolase
MGEPFMHRLRVRFAECDPQGIVFNAHYLAYADVALTELFRAVFGSYANVIERGVDVVVGEANVVFRAPARWDDELEMAVTIAQLGTTSMTMVLVMTRAEDGELLTQTRLRYVWVRLPGYAKTAIPDWAREGLQAHHVLDERQPHRVLDESG